MTLINLNEELDKRTAVIEDKIRNSFKAVKADNDEIKKRIEELSNSLKNSTVSKDLAELGKKVDSNDDNFKKFKKEMARDSLKKEVVKEVMPLFNEKINVGLKLNKLETKELRKDISDFKSKWSSANEEKLNAGLEEMRSNFAKLDKKAISEMRALKISTKRSIYEQNSLIEKYNAQVEGYIDELDVDYRRSKKEIANSTQRNFDSLKEEHNTEIQKLKGQMAYLKGRVNKELGVEVVVSGKKQGKDSKPGLFNKFSSFYKKKLKSEAKSEVKKPEVKSVKVQSSKDKNLFSNLVSLLADESPDIKVEFTPAKKESKKTVAKTPVKKLEKQEDSGFFNSIIKSMSD